MIILFFFGYSGFDHGSNAAWVQIDVMIPDGAGEQEIQGTLGIYTRDL